MYFHQHPLKVVALGLAAPASQDGQAQAAPGAFNMFRRMEQWAGDRGDIG